MRANESKIQLVIFDLDGTLTPVDSLWRYLHEALGTWDVGKIAAQKYWRGEISYTEWADRDARCWSGKSVRQIMNVIERIPYRQGAREVFLELKQRSIKTAILTAGLSILAEKAARELGADLALSNELHTTDGYLTGGITIKVPVNKKKQIIEQIAAQLSLPLSKVALVGDRSSDLPNRECLRIAFKPKDETARKEADFVVEDHDLSKVLQYLL